MGGVCSVSGDSRMRGGGIVRGESRVTGERGWE